MASGIHTEEQREQTISISTDLYYSTYLKAQISGSLEHICSIDYDHNQCQIGILGIQNLSFECRVETQWIDLLNICKIEAEPR